MAWNIADKNCLITGASAGIGLVAARELAARGARVTMLCRNPVKAEPLAKEIAKTSKYTVDLIIADLADRSSIRAAAKQYLAKHDSLEVLINNAGAIFSERELTSDGCERTFALNHLAYFLLTKLLIDRIKGSAPARIINVASAAHRRASLDFADLQGEKRWDARAAYERSKLANIYFTYELARRLEGTGVTANCLHPGVIASEFGKSGSFLVRAFFSLARPFLATVEEGAKTTIHLATAPELEGVTGKYFVRSAEARSSAVSYDREAAARLWEVSEELTA